MRGGYIVRNFEVGDKVIYKGYIEIVVSKGAIGIVTGFHIVDKMIYCEVNFKKRTISCPIDVLELYKGGV